MRTRATLHPGGFWFTLGFGATFLAAGFALAALFAPLIEQKFESLRYRVLEALPPPEHPAFVPTPLPTAPALTQPTDEPTLAPSEPPTDTPTPIAAAQPTAQPTRPRSSPTPAIVVKEIQPSVQLSGVSHDYQRWNNCGPTTLEMHLSFFGVREPQAQIAKALKPNSDDRNVTPAEMTAYARGKGLSAVVRVNGTLERIKQLVSNGLPVMVETGFDPPRAKQGWMGHYRLITGHDAEKFTTQDSYNGPNVLVEFAALDADWRAFNRTYLLLYADAQAPLVRALLGDERDDAKMYAAAVARARAELDANPNDPFAAFNLGSSLLGLRQYARAAAAFDRARVNQLPWRMLWYQFGPYEAYYRVGRYDEVLALAEATLKPADDLEESHYYKGLALEKLGRLAAARAAFALAVKYNPNFIEAQRALARLP